MKKISMRVLIIKAVGDSCNIRCDYCFYNGYNQQKITIMDEYLLSDFFKQYLSLFGGNLRFVWHGGEPLLAGIPFYEQALVLQKKFVKNGDVIENMIQTNATLINDGWAKFFKKYNFRVGISIDGDESSHNKFRRDANGRGTFDRVINGIKVLQKHGIMPGVIQTLTQCNAENIEKDFNFFFKGLGIRGWSVNFYDINSNSNTCLKEFGMTSDDVSCAYNSIVDFWLKQNDKNFSLREIDNIITGVLGRRAKNCSFNGTCANYFCLDYDGSIWPCDRLSKDQSYLFGNLKHQSLEEVLNSKVASEYAKKVRHLAIDCLKCEWQKVCNNGCTAMRDSSTNKYIFCEARKRVFKRIRTLLNIENPIRKEGQLCQIER